MTGGANGVFFGGRNRLRPALLGITVILAVLAVVSSLLAVRYQRSMTEASRYNVTFDLSQAASELLRFEAALGLALRRDNTAEVELRFGIFKNRTGVFHDQAIAGDPDRVALFREIGAELARIDPHRLGNPASSAAITATIDRLRPFVPRILRLSSSSHSQAGDEVQENQRKLEIILGQICATTLALVLFGAILLLVVSRQNRRLDRVVRTDAMTGLANRFAFNAALGEAEGEAKAVVLVGLDHFKAVNDTLGHEAGDRVLVDLSRRLEAAVPDATLIARTGGDEFAILHFGRDCAQRSSVAARAILSAVAARPFSIPGRTVAATVSLGLQVAENAAASASLLDDADIALSCAKLAGRARALAFEPAMKQALLHRQRLLEDLRGAAARGELFLAYQPIVDLANTRTQGFEALLRWRHREFGLIPPAEFIPLAEDSALIESIGLWVIDEACRQAASWPKDIFVAVNVSARQLCEPSLVDHVARCLATHDIAHGRLEIEITESTLIENDATAAEVLLRLHALGCRISLDDFGTGYASLSYLTRFPFHKIKIDRSFLGGGADRQSNEAIVTMVCALAEKLALDVVAEGIETEHHRQLAKAAGGRLGQGYLFDRPLSPDAAERRLAGEARAPEAVSAAA
ncbi:putative bifunctional diguanylate cyclase/phosphodiesterase [Aureimonas psammosilenae]|uniref:putative bifunctional diguanylate cyclase/phosphodiesterase n=1 Tax=Aureimonas psammosilenae TaxID=2495496 RepID=UPI0012613A02|nr:bifunctional diguanylate cyclase/phosphodiesterase [Aureimonas psammosilenae]